MAEFRKAYELTPSYRVLYNIDLRIYHRALDAAEVQTLSGYQGP